MKVKMLQHCGLMGRQPMYKGQVYEVEDKEAKNLIKKKMAQKA